MKGSSNGFDTQTEALIAIGAAVACGCQPCLHRIVEQANVVGISANGMRSAAIIGQYVKNQPAAQMRSLADELLGTHLSRVDELDEGCPLEERAVNAPSGCNC